MAPKSCDQFASEELARPKTQKQIAARAFDLWLARGFRDGSPQEDWLQAQREMQRAAPSLGRRLNGHPVQ
ncbi:MAG TPA: DUF2934 domain-containing protein [Bryobacteraceae bacterium]|nr:DUF2934 domain-containing protein [Bryobacteraceae bacterium]